jgi:hypothetical protein
MSSASRWSWLAASLVVISMWAWSVVLPGCSQAPPPKADQPAGPQGKPSPGATEPPAKPGPQPQPQAKPKPEPQPGPQPQPQPEPKPEPQPQPGPPPQPEPQPGTSGSSAEVKVSAFAPAEDLVSQVPAYIKGLEDSVKSAEDYKDSVENISNDSNTLILIALALGMHDQDNKYKAAAAGLIKAAQDLAATKDFASARKGVAAVKQAAVAQSDPAMQLKWEKVAFLPAVMKKVPLINTKLKGCLRRIERRAKDGQGHAAVLAVVAQGSMANAGDTDKPDEVQKWHQFCTEMRDTAAALNGAIRAKDKEAITATMTKLQQSCDHCHEVFHPEELGKTTAEEEEE